MPKNNARVQGPGEMARWLRLAAARSENWNLFMAATSGSKSQGTQYPLLASLGTCARTHTQEFEKHFGLPPVIIGTNIFSLHSSSIYWLRHFKILLRAQRGGRREM